MTSNANKEKVRSASDEVIKMESNNNNTEEAKKAKKVRKAEWAATKAAQAARQVGLHRNRGKHGVEAGSGKA